MAGFFGIGFGKGVGGPFAKGGGAFGMFLGFTVCSTRGLLLAFTSPWGCWDSDEADAAAGGGPGGSLGLARHWS